MLKFKEEISTLEIYGAQALFNKAFENEFGYYREYEEFFLSCGSLNSESSANGCPIDIYGFELSHLSILENGLLVAVCYDTDEDETAHYFRVEESNITELNV